MSESDWIRTPAGRRENLAATGAALLVASGTAALTWWLVRTVLSREPVDLRPGRGSVAAGEHRGER